MSAGPLTVRLCLLRRCLVDAALLPAPAPELSPRHLARIPGPSLGGYSSGSLPFSVASGPRSFVPRRCGSPAGLLISRIHPTSFPSLDNRPGRLQGSVPAVIWVPRSRLRRGGSQEWDGMRLHGQIAP
ncbi:hypothetical protein DMC30DRAFT_393061 [Rhodotorula diobovata]|uniref:Uncharacterized protein n=1 Tax=Rhodotorula diobovata TaxID=5288 RepID=A0A5C5FZ69_9BASI|nr:hypothetical protein DMC30DRAFT_393061 [Rhodotorula diobovata]